MKMKIFFSIKNSDAQGRTEIHIHLIESSPTGWKNFEFLGLFINTHYFWNHYPAYQN